VQEVAVKLPDTLPSLWHVRVSELQELPQGTLVEL
jgi:autonomous glycyl radical cofactor GrcA